MPVLTTCGKNLCDNSKNKAIEINSTTGAESANSNNVIVSDYIEINPLKTYTASKVTSLRLGSISFRYYNSKKEYIGINKTNEAKYVRLRQTNQNGGLNLDDILFQLEEGSTATTYEPYKSNILSCNEEVTLRGIGDVKDELNLITGELTENVKKMTLNGSENWTLSGTYSNYIELVGIGKLQHSTVGFCDKLPTVKIGSSSENNPVGFTMVNHDGVRLKPLEGNDNSLEDYKQWLKENPVTIYFLPQQKSIKTVVLSDNVVYSYKDTTHYTCSSEDGSLLPTLTIEEGVKYKAIIKPSTKYSIVFNRTEVASGLTVDLGGVTANVSSTTVGKNIVQITTPPTLSHNYVIFKGLGNVIKDVQVIEGDVVGDEPYFEGICDCKSPILSNVGKNLFDANEFKRVFGSNVEIGLDGTIVSLGDIKGGNHNLGFHSPINIALKPNTKYTLCLFNLNTSGQIIGVEGCLSTCNSELSMSNVAINSVGYKVFTTNSQNYKDGVSFKVMTGATTGEKAQHQIMIVEGEVSHETYSPYKSNTTTFNQKDDKTIVLRSLPNGVCDTLNVETGEYTQRIGEVNTKSLQTTVNLSIGAEANVVFVNGINGKFIGWNECNIASDKLQWTYRADINWSKSSSINGIAIEPNGGFWFIVDKTIETKEQVNEFLVNLDATIHYELATPIITTIDLKQHPFAYKDGYVVLTSSSEEVSLTPTIEYSLIANRLGQIQTNQKLVEKQQAQIDELESMVITNLVNTQYQQALNEIKLGVK